MPPSQNSLPAGAQNKFFGQKISQPGVDVNKAADNELLYKNDYSTTTYYDASGNPTVLLGLMPSGLYGLQTNASNGAIITFGTLTNGGLGIQVTDSTGNVIFEMDGATWYWFDPKNGYVNNMQIGLLPDGSYGMAVATNGNSVADAIKS